VPPYQPDGPAARYSAALNCGFRALKTRAINFVLGHSSCGGVQRAVWILCQGNCFHGTGTQDSLSDGWMDILSPKYERLSADIEDPKDAGAPGLRKHAVMTSL